jgi:hypothetical protein
MEYDPEEMTREIMPTYEQTEEYLQKFLDEFGMGDEDEEELQPRRKAKVKAKAAPARKKRRRGDL